LAECYEAILRQLREHDQIVWGTEQTSMLPARRHRAAASILAETRLIAASSAANTNVFVDQRGLPLAAQISGAQVHDSRLLRPLC
jgi:hypothetical protein